jgi:L-amino acid N-acyltransferase YncA
MSKIFVRLANKKDIRKCINLALERDADLKKTSRSAVWRLLLTELIESKSLIIALSGKEITGFCYFSPFLFSDNINLYIQLIYIPQNQRRKGIGKALIKKVQKISKSRGADKLFSSCEHDNLASLKFHKKLGFEKCGFIKNIGKENRKEIFFSKRLFRDKKA